ncbi:hypothetical protein [Desulfovibrio sp. JC010]|uniref:hypothetical protein n=1 Tax=Desulfovibrio sp. JC010 TaxID=2593641 RepID=UPI0013D66919|nr:hypothetical protein [Desulfovibrio sp. JC010]NDV27708.1 hypothetical protein [Desulfovibrio sp. JC010]
MKEMVAGIRVTARTDSKLTRALNDTERGLEDVGKTATRQARVITRASEREQRATTKTSRATSVLSRTFDRAGQSARRYGQKLKANLKQLRATEKLTAATGRGLDALDNRYTAMVSGLGLGVAGKQVGDLQERMVRLKNAAGATDDQMDKLKSTIYAVAKNKDIRIRPDELLGAVEEYVAKTGDFESAFKNVRALALGIQAYGSSGLEIGSLSASSGKSFGIENISEILALISSQGDVGAVEAKDMVTYLPEVSGAYAETLNRKGMEGLREVGALLQGLHGVTNNVSASSTAVQAFLREYSGRGDQIREKFGVEATGDDGRKKAVHQIVNEILAAVDGDIDRITKSGVFTGDSSKLFLAFKSEENKKTHDKAISVSSDEKVLIEKSRNMAKTFNAGLTYMGTIWEQFVDNKLSGIVGWAGDYLSNFSTKAVENTLGVLSTAAIGVGGLLAGRKVWGGIKATRDFFGKGKNASVASTISEGVTAASSGITPVKVTNWPGDTSLRGADLGDGKNRKSGKGRTVRAARTASKSGRFSRITDKAGAFFSKFSNSKIFRTLGKAAAPVGVTLNALDLVGAVSSGDSSQIGGSLGGMAGSAGGAMAGAALGSVVPVVGTALGGILGAVLGSYAGEFAGSEAAELVTHTETNNIDNTTRTDSTQQIVKEVHQHQGDTVNHFHITQQPGESAEALARKVMAMIERKQRNNGALHDGV